MANRVAPTRIDAVNSAGNFTSAACSDWRAVGRFHVGTGHREPTIDAGYVCPLVGYDCMRFPTAKSIDQFPCFLGESIYVGLGGFFN